MINAKTWNPAQIDQAIRRLEGIIRSGSYNPAELNQLLNQLGEPGYINTWNPAELDQKLRTLLHDLLTWKTATGNPIQLRTNNGGLVQSCEVTFSPIQSGSGEPSPTNVRPISGRDSLHLYQDTEQTETPDKTYTATFSETVYGGTLDETTGKLTVNKVIIDIGDITLYYDSGSTRFYSSVISDLRPCQNSQVADVLSTIYRAEKVSGQSSLGDYSIGVSNDSRFYVFDKDYSDVLTYKTARTGQKICYKLATPTEITLTPEDIELLAGENVLWTDGDNIEITYKKLLLPSDVETLSKKKIIEEKPKTKRSKKKKEE